MDEEQGSSAIDAQSSPHDALATSRAAADETASMGDTSQARRQRLDALKQDLMGSDLLTVSEVAEILDLQPQVVGTYIRTGVLLALRRGDEWKISESALRDFVHTQPHSDARPGAVVSGTDHGISVRRQWIGTSRCSFCGKEQELVKRLIAGPGGVHICDECVTLCNQMIAER